MGFANPWGLLGLLSLPAIVGIHLYHRRFPVLPIASAHLWGLDTETRQAGRRRDRLPITASLLLELLTALIISLILARPNFAGLNHVTHLVVVLDNSASMAADPPGDESLRVRAIDELQKRVKRSGRTVLTLIQTGTRPEALNGTPVDWSQAQKLLEQWQPHKAQHDFQPAWDVASQLAADSGELLFLTNRLPPESTATPKLMEVVAVGRPLPNLALTTAHWGFHSSTQRNQITLRVHNLGSEAAQCSVQGRNGQDTILTETLTLQASENRPLEFEIPPGLAQVTLEISSKTDALAIDNRALLIAPRKRLVRYHLNLPPDASAHTAVQRVLQEVTDLQIVPGAEADLIIDQASQRPESRAGLWWLGIGPLDATPQAQQTARDLLGPFLIEKRAALLEGVVLGGIIWGGVQEWNETPQPLVSSGNLPLLGKLRSTETQAFLINGDLERSNLTDSPDWPILISNLIELCRADQPGLQRWNYRLNEEFRFRGPSTDGTSNPSATLTLKTPQRKRLLALDRDDWVEIRDLDQTGLYTIVHGDETWDRFSVNFENLSQSNLLSLATGHQPAATRPTSSLALDDPYTWLTLLGIVLGLCCIVLNWQHLRKLA